MRWQRHTATLLGKILELAANECLPAINWTVANAGATLHGECIVPHAVRREYFTAWREAITSASGADPDSTGRPPCRGVKPGWLPAGSGLA
jgi:hypothetical protein